MRILYVEDQVDEQTPVARLLFKQNHDVTIINNVFEALDFLKTHEIDILLCDYSLGEGPDGLIVAENARNLHPACTIVMISGYLNTNNAVEAMQIGADDFVQRPISLDELLNRLWKAYARRQRRTQIAPRAITQETMLLHLDLNRHSASWEGHPLDLTHTEFVLLEKLASRPGQMFTFNDLWASIRGEWLSPQEARKLLKPHINNLRTKLSALGADKETLRNVRGAGYLWSID